MNAVIFDIFTRRHNKDVISIIYNLIKELDRVEFCCMLDLCKNYMWLGIPGFSFELTKCSEELKIYIESLNFSVHKFGPFWSVYPTRNPVLHKPFFYY